MRLCLLLTLILLVQVCRADPLARFAHVCNLNGELSIIWPAAGNETGARVCLYNQNLPAAAPVVLTNATNSVKLPDGRLHTVFKILPDILKCRYYYKWKIEATSTTRTGLVGATEASSNCMETTPTEHCEIEMGSSTLCPGWAPISVPLECMVVPPGLKFLLDTCRPTESGVRDAGVAVVVSLLVAVLAVVALVLLIRRYRRRRAKSRPPLPSSWPAQRVHPVESAFALLSDNAQAKRFVLAGRELHPPGSCVTSEHLLVNPDTREIIRI